jgi:hypothetical protein
MKRLCLPYCPGIPWDINDQDMIVKKLNGDPRYLLTKNINIVCHGGLLESFFSTYAIEYIKTKYPEKNIFWHGKEEFKDLIKNQGLANYSSEITEEISNSYPIHFFKDKENNTYFNLLDNYQNYHTYLGRDFKKNKNNFIDVFNKNFMIDNLLHHPFKSRNISQDFEYTAWCKLNKNVLSKPYVLILPDRLTGSMHKQDFVNLTMMELRALSSVLSLNGIQTIIMSNDHSKYYGNFKFIKYSFSRFLSLAQNAKVVLSRQPDYSIISLLMFKSSTYSYYLRHMPKIKLKPTMRRVKGAVDPEWRYLKYQNTLPAMIEQIIRKIYER